MSKGLPGNNETFEIKKRFEQKLQFSTDFIQNYTMHPSTIALSWQQRMSHGTGCTQNESLSVNSKSHKV